MTVVLEPSVDLRTLPTERLEAEATTLAGHLAAATCRFLEVVAELARREAWCSWELRSMAHWVSWKCGVGLRAAHEQVRVATALDPLPAIHAAFSVGELSYSKVRALTRFTTPETEAEDLELARNTTAHQLDRIAAAHRLAVRLADPDQARAQLAAASVTSSGTEDGMIRITAVVPADLGRKVMKVIDLACDELPRDLAHQVARRRVDGLEAVVDAFTDDEATRRGTELVVRADLAALAEDRPGVCTLEEYGITTETARRLACDCGVRLAVEQDGVTLDLGRRARVPNPKLREKVTRRDGHRCRFPGCTQRARLRVHHAQHWAKGGPTDAWNLVCLCPTHHRAVHEGGWNVVADGHGGFTFVDPRGRPVPEVALADPCPPAAAIERTAAEGITIAPSTLQGGLGEPMDLHYVMSVVCQSHPPECSAEHSRAPS